MVNINTLMSQHFLASTPKVFILELIIVACHQYGEM